MQTLAVFDFDKTVYKKNSLVDFTIFTIGSPQFALRFLIFLPFYLLFKARLTDDNACKAKFLTIFYKNRTIERLLSDADLYSKQRISHHLDSFHLDRINRHRNAGHKLVVLTATFRFVLESWCKSNGVDLIATDVQVINQRITGRLKGCNCYGKAKVAALKKQYKIEDYYIIGYGDSKSDLPFLSLADEAYYRKQQIHRYKNSSATEGLADLSEST